MTRRKRKNKPEVATSFYYADSIYSFISLQKVKWNPPSHYQKYGYVSFKKNRPSRPILSELSGIISRGISNNGWPSSSTELMEQNLINMHSLTHVRLLSRQERRQESGFLNCWHSQH